jgi:hypothetical protein
MRCDEPAAVDTVSGAEMSGPRQRRAPRRAQQGDLVARHVISAGCSAARRPALMHDQLLAQSAAGRPTSTCHELVIDGESYRKRQRPRLGSGT